MYGIFTYVNGWAFMVNVGTVKIPYMDPMGYTDCLSRDLYHNGLWHKRPKPKTIPIQNVEFFILMFVHRMLSVHPDQKLNIRSLNHPAGLSTCCYIQSMLSWECKGIRLQSLAQQKPESPWVGPLIIPMMVMLVSKDMFECWNKVKLGKQMEWLGKTTDTPKYGIYRYIHTIYWNSIPSAPVTIEQKPSLKAKSSPCISAYWLVNLLFPGRSRGLIARPWGKRQWFS